MSGNALTALRIGLFGKLPAHGDFVRRGDPARVTLIDDWLTVELTRLAADDPHGLDDRIAGLSVWRFVVDTGSDRVAGVLSGSRDRVGRLFPLILFRASPSLSATCADEWTLAAETLAVAAIGGGQDADTLFAALSAIPSDPGSGPDADPAPTGWRSGDWSVADPSSGLPSGDAFARLFPSTPAVEAEI